MRKKYIGINISVSYLPTLQFIIRIGRIVILHLSWQRGSKESQENVTLFYLNLFMRRGKLQFAETSSPPPKFQPRGKESNLINQVIHHLHFNSSLILFKNLDRILVKNDKKKGGVREQTQSYLLFIHIPLFLCYLST